MVPIPGGVFYMRSDDPFGVPENGEGPVRAVRLAPFLIDVTAVTNAAFAGFVEATGYVTDAEQLGWSFGFVGERHIGDPVVKQTPGGRRSTGPIGGIPSAPRAISRIARIIPPSMFRGTMPPCLHAGPASGCRPRPNGNAPLVAVSISDAIRGATSSCRTANSGAGYGRGHSLPVRPMHNVPERARCESIRPPTTACTGWQAMSGTGVPTGSIQRITCSLRAKTRLVPPPANTGSCGVGRICVTPPIAIATASLRAAAAHPIAALATSVFGVLATFRQQSVETFEGNARRKLPATPLNVRPAMTGCNR